MPSNVDHPNHFCRASQTCPRSIDRAWPSWYDRQWEPSLRQKICTSYSPLFHMFNCGFITIKRAVVYYCNFNKKKNLETRGTLLRVCSFSLSVFIFFINVKCLFDLSKHVRNTLYVPDTKQILGCKPKWPLRCFGCSFVTVTFHCYNSEGLPVTSAETSNQEGAG